MGRLFEAQRSRNLLHTWNFAGGDEGWKSIYQCLLEQQSGSLAVTSTGKEPQFGRELWAPAGWKELTICARVDGNHHSQLFWTAADARATTEGMSVRFPMNDSGGEWREYHVYFSPDSDLASLRFDPYNKSGQLVEIAWMTLANRSLDQAIEAHPDDAELYVMRAQAYQAQEEALGGLNEVVKRRGNGGIVCDWLFLAMTHHQLGHADEARQRFHKAAALPVDGSGPVKISNRWKDRLYLEYLRREAAKLLGN